MRDFAQVKDQQLTDEAFVQDSLRFLGMDEEGLSKVDNLILMKIVENFNGGPVGLETIASLIGEDKDTIESVYEPFLLRKGYLEKTPRGRQIPHKKMPHLKRKFLGQETIL